MASKVCITLDQEVKLKKAVSDGEFSLNKIKDTKSSSERFELINKYLDDEELSKKVVREMEKRLSSKRETIIADYINRTFTGIPENTTKGVFNKFKRMSQFLGAKEEKDFLEELVGHKFGAYITKEEANKLEALTNEAIVLSEKIPDNLTTEIRDFTPEELAYGRKIIELEKMEGEIKLDRAGFSYKDYKKMTGKKGAEYTSGMAKYAKEGILEASGATRSFLASSDVSAVFRQQWKLFSSGFSEAIYNGVANAIDDGTRKNFKFKIWRNSLNTTWQAIKTTYKYGDHRFYDEVRAQIHADPFSRNGLFDAASNGYGVRVGSEEQFPSSIPSDFYDKYISKVAGKKANFFKISEVAFNAVVLQSRHELARHTISILKESGLNMMDKKFADPAGEFVSAFTGRGGLGKFEGAATSLNKIFFAPKYAASQFSPYYQIVRGATTQADNKASRFALEQNIQYIIGSAALMLLGETVRSFIMGEEPDYTSVINPQSNNFGKVNFPGTETTLDFTGGNRSVYGLMTGIFTNKYYDSRLGIWRQKNMFQTSDGKALWDFASSKFAPVPSIIRDLIKGEHFGGLEVSTQTIVSNLLIPITVANFWEEANTKDTDLSTAMMVLTAEGLGIGASDMRFKPANDEWKALLNTDKKAYWRAVDELWNNVQGKVKEYRDNPEFQALDEKAQRERLEKMYTRELDKVIKQEQYRTVSKDKLKEIKAGREEF